MNGTDLLSKWREKALLIIGSAATLFYLYYLVIVPLSPDVSRPIHMLLVSAIVFLAYPGSQKGKGRLSLTSLTFLLLSVATFVYALVELENILDRGGVETTPLDLVFGSIAIIVVLETTRRTVGWALPIIAAAFLLYAMVGNYIPGPLGHTGYSFKRIITSVYTYEGIFGIATAVMATFVAMFIIFAEFMDLTGVGKVFLDLAKSVAGRLVGGPAKMATMGSCLFGTISGSAVANVASVGSFTIPLMKKSGYQPYFAAAVEAAASTGGQIMPPVMAAGAFLMAEILGISYTAVIKAALIPALFYYALIWLTIDAVSRKQGLKGIDPAEIPRFRDVVRQKGLALLPLLTLIVTLVVMKYSPIKSAFYSLVVSLVVSFIQKETRPNLATVANTMAKAAKGIAAIGAACACAGIVIGVISLTGVGLKIATLIISLSAGNALLALTLSMLTAVLFGMGLPTTVSYLLCVAVLAPVLTKLGVTPLAAHMFIFYYACLSGITPPVALAAYTAAGIAGAEPMRTGFKACQLALAAFIFPYMFVYNTGLLMQGPLPGIGAAIVLGIVLCYALTGIFEGHLRGMLPVASRVVLAGVAVCIIAPNRLWNAVGCAVFAGVLAVQFVRVKATASVEA